MLAPTRFLAISLPVMQLLSGLALGQAFVPQVVLVSDPAGDIRDPEFDQIGYHVTWQDKAGNLWLADVDPLTGDISPADGKGQLLDTGLYSFAKNANGPEWAYGNGKANIVYVVDDAGIPQLRAARADSAGNWGRVVLSGADFRRSPLGSPVSNSGAPMIAYRAYLSSGATVAGWRNLYKASSEMISGAGAPGGRFVDGGNGIITLARFNDELQIALIDLQTKAITQLTFDAGEKFSPFMWWAPELGEYLLLTVVDSTILAVYRESGGQWQRHLSLNIPSRFQYLASPEVQIFNGVSYFAIVVAERLEPNGPLQHWPAGKSEIWVGGVDPTNPFFRRVDDPTRDALRVEPEFLVLSGGVPMLYYSEHYDATNRALLFLATTGLDRQSVSTNR